MYNGHRFSSKRWQLVNSWVIKLGVNYIFVVYT